MPVPSLSEILDFCADFRLPVWETLLQRFGRLLLPQGNAVSESDEFGIIDSLPESDVGINDGEACVKEEDLEKPSPTDKDGAALFSTPTTDNAITQQRQYRQVPILMLITNVSTD